MPCESTPRRLEATRQRAVTDALCGGTPAAVRMSSQKRVRGAAEMEGTLFQRSVRASKCALSRRAHPVVHPVTTPGQAPCDTRTGRRVMAKQEGLQQLLVDELQDLFDAETQLVKALPKL